MRFLVIIFSFLFMIGLSHAGLFGGDPEPMTPDYSTAFTIVITCLLAISEALALIPGLKSNSILQLIINLLKMLKRKT